MSHVETIYGAKPKDEKLRAAGAQSHGTLAKPMRMPFTRRLNQERLPLPAAANSAEGRFVRVIENQETGCFEGEFSFKLTGVVLNGRFPGFSEQFVKGKGTTGDRLMSRLLPLLHGNANIRFIFGGGGEANFQWIIQGNVQSAGINPEARVTEIGCEAVSAIVNRIKSNEFKGNFRELETVMRAACQAAAKDGRDFICIQDIPSATSRCYR